MNARIASFGMYDRPELHAANDALWAGIRDYLEGAGLDRLPLALDRGRPLAAIWDDPGLLIGQTCGYPLMTTWRGRLRYLATPRYRAPGCDGAEYRSRIVVRRDDPAATLADLRGRRAAINEPGSNSGMNLLRAAVAPLAAGQRFFANVIETGSHTASARSVAAGTADVAAIDTVTFAHLERFEPAVAHRLRTLDWTPASPGLPLVTATRTSDREIAALQDALDYVATSDDLADARATLLIDGFERLPPSRYETILVLEDDARRAGYPVLA